MAAWLVEVLVAVLVVVATSDDAAMDAMYVGSVDDEHVDHHDYDEKY